MIISETLMQIARIPSPSDSDAEGMKVSSADSDPPLHCSAEYGSARPILQQNVSTSRSIKPDGKLDDPLLDKQIQDEVHDRFGIGHMTVQLECGNADHSCSQEPKHVV
jgi:hypothetical protein